MELKAGSRLQSRVCDTQVIVVRAPGAEMEITCGGISMIEAGAQVTATDALDGLAEGTLMGKRYIDGDETIELLCTKAGSGTLGVGATPMVLKEAKALPASD